MSIAVWIQTPKLAICWQWSTVMLITVFLNGQNNFIANAHVCDALCVDSAVERPTCMKIVMQ